MQVFQKYPHLIGALIATIGVGLLASAVSNWYLLAAGGLFLFLGYFMAHFFPTMVSVAEGIVADLNAGILPDTHVVLPTANNVVSITEAVPPVGVEQPKV
jgi:hypothetical protein